MNSFQKFKLKHYYPNSGDINPKVLISIYGFLPHFITILSEIPRIKDFRESFTYSSGDRYRSIKKFELNLINTKSKTITHMYAYIYICFVKKRGKYIPVHIDSIDFDTSTFISCKRFYI